MECGMRKLRKIAGVTIFLILFFMIIALLRFQREEELFSVLPDRLEYNFNEGWTIAAFSGAEAEDAKQNGGMRELFDRALSEGACREADLPYSGECAAGDIVVYGNVLPEEYAGLTLNFASTGAAVTVLVDGEVIYQYAFPEDDILVRIPETRENFMTLPNVFQGGELRIEMVSPYPDLAARLGDVKIETRDMVIIGVVGNNFADIGCCMLIVFTAIIMFVLALIRHYTHQPTRGEAFLGLTGLAAGIYCFIGTDTLSIFYNVQEAYEMQEYLVLMLPLFLTLYFERNFHMVYPRRFSVLLWCVSIHAAVQILLQFLGIQSMRDMGNISAVAVGAVCVFAIVSLIQFDYRNRCYQTLLSILAMLVLLSGGVANVIMNTFFHSIYGNAAGQYSMAVFAVMMTVMHILQLSKEYRASAEENARLLQEKVNVVQQQNIQLSQAKHDAEAARQEALAANEAKGKFLAHMSHEIRTPINAVLGMDEMILRESGEENIKEYAMDIYMAGQTLLSLINDILDFSKIDSGKMEIVPVEYDISSMIHDLANMASQRAKDKNISLEVEVDHEIPSRLYGDDVRIRQVLTNILTNAVKYTHEGHVWLRVQSRGAEDGVMIRFEVEDTGIGIREEDLPKLSAEFERIEEERNRNIEGTGLGMSITLQLLSLMGSRLQVESVYGEGSRFYFELEQKVIDPTPIGDFEARVQQLAENYSYSARVYAPDAQILVVDDNAVNRKVLRNLLKETQIHVTDAGGGAECLELVRKNHYDLIFLDHMMPEMDGVETLHRMRKLADYPCRNTPVIVLTANAVTGAKEKYLSEGFDDFLSKPVVPEKLEIMIKKHLPKELQMETSPGSQTVSRQKAGEPDKAGDFLETLPMVDGLDWQYAWLHLPDEELLAYTVKEFYEQLDSSADKLLQAYERLEEPEQLDRYRIQVHAMKSLAATVGIASLSGVAKLLEYAARDGQTDRIRAMTGVFLEEWRSYKQKLEGVFGLGVSKKETVADFSVIQAIVEMIRLSMQEMDIDQADQLVGQLRTYEYPDEMEKNIGKLAEAVTNLDPEETERLAGILIGQMEE